MTTAAGEAGRDGDAGTGTRGRVTDLVLLQLLHQHLRQRRTVRPGRLLLLRPPARSPALLPSGLLALPPRPPARTHLRRSATRASREVAGDEEVQLCGERRQGRSAGGRAAPGRAGPGDARPRLTRLDERHRTSGWRRLRHGGARGGRAGASGAERSGACRPRRGLTGPASLPPPSPGSSGARRRHAVRAARPTRPRQEVARGSRG